ncbi:MAG: hypothetical protein ACR2I9_01035 [Candidatus Nanopelagicaceae bacterium]|jgi:hypothetical protein
MKEIFAFAATTVLVLALVAYIGSKRKRVSRYERNPESISDWQKLDRGIDPSE